MTRLAALLVVALAVLAVGSERVQLVDEALGAGGVEVVVALESPPLAHAPGSAARIAAEQRAFRARLARSLPDARVRWRYRLVTNGFAVVLPAAQLPRLRAIAGVRDVYDATGYEPQLDSTPQAIGAPALWGAGLDTAGQGVKIGIIDTGVNHAHPFFDPSGYAMPAGFPKGQIRFTNAKVIVARAFAPPGAKSPRAGIAVDGENSSHGTHVAGIAAGNPRTRTGEAVVSGVAPRAYLGNYKALVGTDFGLSPNGNAPEIVAAIEAAVRDGMDVLNLSIGEPEIEPRRDVVALALDAAAAAGVVPVVAAGNDFNDLGAGTVSSPANSAAAITVAAVEMSGTTGTHADFSSVGPTAISLRQKPDVAAPGVGVLSSVPEGWSSLSGTSMASPHVAGAAALLVQRHPSWTTAQVKSALVQSAADGRVSGDRAPGPEFQGGGLVALARADNPLLFAQPTGISFGLLQGRGAADEGSVMLGDAGGGAGTWNVTVQTRRTTPGVSLALGTSQVTVPGELAYEVRTGRAPRAGDFSGYLVLRRGTDVRRIPFWGRYTEQRLGRHRVALLRRAGTYKGNTAGKPAHVSRYRYPENPRGVGLTTVLRGPESVYRVRLPRRVANLGVVITQQARGSRVEPRVVAGLDENRLTGYAGLPLHHNPYLQGFRRAVPAAGVLSPLPADFYLVFDSAARAGAGRFTFRLWINDVKPPVLRLRTRSVRTGAALRVSATDAGSGVYPGSITARIDGENVSTFFRSGVVRIGTSGFGAGRHRLVLRVSDYQETKNTENVARILPNTRELRATFTVRG
jgi:subtilisin family serine protease